MYGHDRDELLLLALRTRAAGEPLPHAVHAWLAGAVQALLDGSAVDLESALGLPRGAGQHRLHRRLRRRARDEHLQAALAAVAADHDRAVPLWERCCRLAAEIAVFRRRPLPLVMPDGPAVRRHLWLAARCGIGLPATAQGLYALADRHSRTPGVFG
jgi:hypothetical protein